MGLPVFRRGYALLLSLALLQSCSGVAPTLKGGFVPPDVTIDSLGPKYQHNVSQIAYWDRISSANRATNFSWWDSAGTLHQMFDYYDKVVVLTFFGTWSPPGISQLPVLDSARSSGDTNVLFIGIAMREGVTGGKAVIHVDSFAQAHHIPYEILIGSRDFGFTYGGIDAVPMTFVITRRRRVNATFDGLVSTSQLLDAISKAEQKP